VTEGNPLRARAALVWACARGFINQELSCAFVARVTSLLLVQKRSNQEKTTPRLALAAHSMGGKSVRLGRVSRRYILVPSRNARPPAEHPAGLVVPASPPHRGPEEWAGHAWPALGAQRLRRCESAAVQTCRFFGECAQVKAGMPEWRQRRSSCPMRARCSGPLCGGEAETIRPRSGHRHDADAFSTVHGRAAEKPGSDSRTFHPGMGGKRQAGWPFSWVTFSLAKQRESDSGARGARKFLIDRRASESTRASRVGWRRIIRR